MSITKDGVTTRIVRAVADETDRDVLDMPVLHHSVDPDGLEQLVEGMSEGAITFTYADRTVTVYADGAVDVDESALELDAPSPTAIGD